ETSLLFLPQIPNRHVPDPARCSGGEHGVRRTGPRCHLPPQDATAALAPHLLLRCGAPGGGVTLRRAQQQLGRARLYLPLLVSHHLSCLRLTASPLVAAYLSHRHKFAVDQRNCSGFRFTVPNVAVRGLKKLGF
uniref:Uncharacterized protein n=1 Tax=Aegilops tauschii subsp. strangulata TaxID=200361 RepID=A0A453NS23_AEGTS